MANNYNLSVKQYIEIIKKIEIEYSTLTTSQILDSLRLMAGYDGELFKLLLGMQNRPTKK